MNVLEISNFTKYYGDFCAVNNLNINIEKGEIVGFVGKNGAGKSTTIRAILNMISQSSGTIKIFGLDNIKNSKEIKSRTAYVSSQNAIYDNLTCLEVLEFCLKFSSEDKSRIYELAEYFDLDLVKKTSELSFGNKKKLAIISAFVKNSELLIFDEASNGLDPLIQNKFFTLLLEEKKKGKTIFLSSHNLAEIERYCDKVAIIKDGVLLDYFTVKDVTKKASQTVSYTTKDGNSYSFELNEDINSLISKLSKLEIEKLEIKSRTVEDEFIEYYKEEKE